MNNCDNHETCIKNNKYFPEDKDSLYANHIVDNQNVRRKCYENGNKANITEGFSISKSKLVYYLKIALIILVLYVVSCQVMKYFSKEMVSINTQPNLQDMNNLVGGFQGMPTLNKIFNN